VNPSLEVRGVSKSYGTHRAVRDVSFALRGGELVGLLGPNGAGKSTSVAIISGLLPADSGEVLINGERLQADDDPRKRLLGLVPQDLALYEELSAYENLRLFGSLYGLFGPALDAAIQAAIALVGLDGRQSDRVNVYSGGMKRRLNLAAGLLHDPEILLLDEPTVGVDPQSRNAIFENIEALKRRGKAVLYTTHYMEEAERLADRVVVIDHGQVVADGTIADLKRRIGSAEGAKVTLEDVFLALTGRTLRDT
jgi:ABC-2 type transport system ATP-binding protein